MTPFQKHVAKWKDCRRCDLCQTRTNVVIARGKIPATVLFVGEAPGASEDVIGRPFVGPAGRLLDYIIEKSIPEGVRYCLTNLVGCIPLGDDGNKTQEPSEESIEKCAPRLKAFIALCKPSLLVCVGKLAEKWVPETEGVPQVGIYHPAAILRMEISQKSLAVKRTIITLQDAVEDL